MFKILLIFCIAPCFVMAQKEGLEIVKDQRLDLLLKKQVELNRKTYIENNRTAQGFRILVLNTSDRTKAMDVKSTLMRDFPEHKTYLIYQSPHFKIQIGNFRTRNDAETLRKQLTRIYPTGIIVIPSTIEVKSEEDILLN
jgi:SPOR domain